MFSALSVFLLLTILTQKITFHFGFRMLMTFLITSQSSRNTISLRCGCSSVWSNQNGITKVNHSTTQVEDTEHVKSFLPKLACGGRFIKKKTIIQLRVAWSYKGSTYGFPDKLGIKAFDGKPEDHRLGGSSGQEETETLQVHFFVQEMECFLFDVLATSCTLRCLTCAFSFNILAQPCERESVLIKCLEFCLRICRTCYSA